MLNPIFGDHEYITPPEPFNWVVKPEQIVTSAPAFACITAGTPKIIFPKVVGA